MAVQRIGGLVPGWLGQAPRQRRLVLELARLDTGDPADVVLRQRRAERGEVLRAEAFAQVDERGECALGIALRQASVAASSARPTTAVRSRCRESIYSFPCVESR